MDRRLTDKEKTENKAVEVYSRSVRISHRFIITRSLLIAFLITPLIVDYFVRAQKAPVRWNESRGLAPDPKENAEPILQVYTARTRGIKGAFAVHSWIAMKPSDAKGYEVCQVIGWRRDRLGNVLFRENITPDRSWYGNEPTLILDLRGDHVESIIHKVDTAISEYPWANRYQVFPGPNSNTFVAWIGLKVPELGLDLPSTAIGKDWRPLAHSLGLSASGTGVQASLFGLLGTSIGFEEGFEFNILGLNTELDLFDLSLEIPLFGRFGTIYVFCYTILWFSLKRWMKRRNPKYIQL